MARATLPNLPAYLPAALRTLGQPITCPKDGWVFRKGDAVQAVFLVLDGEVRLSRFAKDGSEIALHRAGRGEFFAEAALNAPRYHCNAIASQPSTLLAFPAGKVRELLAKDPEFAHQWVALLARQLHAARARLERLALKSAAERVLHYLHTEGKGPRCEVTLAGSVKDLAKELGLTHESLYRTLARLEQDGVVARSDHRLGLV
jgi:CRP/FNR family transcriptional regulator, dissimilatory nitrate respiration regulator